MAMESIEELFEHELKDMLGAEQSLLDALEQMASESSDREIKKAYTQHRKETLGTDQASREDLQGARPEARSGNMPGIEGLIKEKKVFMREKPTEELLEFYNLGAGQKTERYEITSYENLIDMADKLGCPMRLSCSRRVFRKRKRRSTN
jgi:ferritin-like metal-binding protein YciE